MCSKSVVIICRAWYPNHQVLFDKLAALLLTKEIKLYYLLLHPVEDNRPWNPDNYICQVNPLVLEGHHINLFGKEIMYGQNVVQVLNEIKPSLVIITPWSELPLYFAKFWALFNNVPSVAWLMGPRKYNWSKILFIRSILSKFLLKIFVKRISYIFAYGDSVKEEIHRITKFNLDKIVNVKHSVDHNIYSFINYSDKIESRLKVRLQLGVSNQELVFGFIGQLIFRKGILNLLKVCDQLWLSGDRFKLYILGSGPLQNDLDFYIQKWPHNIIQQKHTSSQNLKEIFSILDLVVVPSLFDDWSTVINEAFHAGIPVVASKGAYSTLDLVEDEINGYSYDEIDTDGLKIKLRKVLDNPDYLITLGSNAQNFINKNWTIDISATIWFKQIVKILNVKVLN